MTCERNFTPYQLVHLLKLRKNGLNGLLIADGVGVGKTISAGYIIEFTIKLMKKNCIVCCPPVLEEKWIQELSTRFGRKAYSVKQNENFDLMIEEMNTKSNKSPQVYILPYSTAIQRDFSKISGLGCIILDEVHHARNPETKLFQKMTELSKKSTYRVGLSATPIHNSLKDLMSIFSILFPIADHDVWEFILKELWAKNKVALLHPFITKFDKQKLGIHFTERDITQIEIDLPAGFHHQVEGALEKKGVSRGSPLTAFEKSIFYRLSTSSAGAFFHALGRSLPADYPDHKLETLYKLVTDASPGRWVIFTEFTVTAELLKEALSERNPCIISGASSFGERYLAIDNFRKDPNGVLIMMPVGCEGLDLQICSRLINYDLHWNPMVIEQRIGRIDRIGQEKKLIHVYNFLITGSIDHHMLTIMRDKLGIVSDTFAGIDSILGGESGLNEKANGVFDSMIDLKGFQIMTNISSALPSLDYDLQKILSPELCEIENWPSNIEDWDGPYHWIDSLDAHRILNLIQQDSFGIYNILADYI